MKLFQLTNNSSLTKVQQISLSIVREIDKGVLEKGARLPSINDFSHYYGVARDTVEKAYKELRAEGYITSVATKGFYVLGKQVQQLKILLILDNFSPYKKQVYDAFVAALGSRAKIELQIHQCNPKVLKEIMDSHLGNFHYYVVMPHFLNQCKEKDYLKLLKRIPAQELILLDKDVPKLEGNYRAVFQDFRLDVYDALQSATDLFQKYARLTLVFPTSGNLPSEIIDGVLAFCLKNKKEFAVVAEITDALLQPGTSVVVLTEADLAQLVKKVRKAGFTLGQEVGVISFNDTVLKELLDITVITTDFEEMGRAAARLILEKQITKIRNSFYLIRRNSV